MKFARPRLLSALFFVAIAAVSVRAADLPQWQPDETQLKNLDRKVTEKVFSARPPIGYVRQVRRGPDGMELLGWTGPLRQDRTQSYLMYAFFPMSDEDRDKDTLESQLDKLLYGVESRRSGFTRTPTELGQIEGATYARAYWKGKDRVTGANMVGFYYVTRIKGGLMGISTQDSRDYEATDVHLVESAALTTELRK